VKLRLIHRDGSSSTPVRCGVRTTADAGRKTLVGFEDALIHAAVPGLTLGCPDYGPEWDA
jgi:hypothetical protein